MKVRKFEDEDTEKVHDLICAAIDNSEGYDKETKDRWKGLNTPEKINKRGKVSKSFVGLDDKNQIVVVGCLEKDGNVISLFVDPKHQRKGYGKTILKRIEEEARKKGLREIHLHCPFFSKEFYEKQSFIAAGPVRDFMGFKSVKMVKRLD